ncbi:hypothetical protein CR513_23360, partial [Mucuna pruriens]
MQLITVANGDHILQHGGRLELLKSKFLKCHYATFSPNHNKNLVPFDPIHSNVLRSDNDIEFVNLKFSKFLKDNDVVHELTCVNTPRQNGAVEKKNRHLKVARALLFQIFIPNVYWGKVVLSY